MLAVDAIQVEGLTELRKAMKELDAKAPKALKLALNEAAGIVQRGAQRRTPVGKTGRARASVKVASTQQRAAVKGGGSNAPYFGFLDYGNKVHGGRHAVGRGDSQPRRFIPTGRIMYPAFEAQRDNIHAVLSKALMKAVDESGL